MSRPRSSFHYVRIEPRAAWRAPVHSGSVSQPERPRAANRVSFAALPLALLAACGSGGLSQAILPDAAGLDLGVPELGTPDLGASCLDGVRDGDETDVDCGGSRCPSCSDGLMCGGDRDCKSTHCQSGACVSCQDSTKNQDETDIDCGGTVCPGCPLGSACRKTTDCLSKGCLHGRCVTPLTPSFLAPITIATGETLLQDVVTGDFNGDGKLDLASTTFGLSANLVYAVGRGDGHFADAVTVAAHGAEGLIAAGDLNEDRRDDLVLVVNQQPAVALANPGGGFFEPVAWTSSVNPRILAVADIDGDKHLDVVTVGGPGPTTACVLRGDGKGGRKPEATTANVGDAPSRVATGDLDADGRSDVVVSDSSVDLVGGWLGRADGTVKNAFLFNPMKNGQKPNLNSVSIADMNQDGVPDVVFYAQLNGVASGNVLLNNGSGAVKAGPAFAVCTGPFYSAVADINRDGAPDVIVGCIDDQVLSVYLGDGRGGAVGPSPAVMLGGAAEGVVTGDFNRDGKVDVAVNVAHRSFVVLINSSR